MLMVNILLVINIVIFVVVINYFKTVENSSEFMFQLTRTPGFLACKSEVFVTSCLLFQ